MKIAKLLLKNGANINVPNSDGLTALHLASICNKREEAKLLLEINCDLSVKDKNSKTAEDWAIQMNHKEIIALILDKQKELLSLDQPPNSENLAENHGDCKICFEPKTGIFVFLPCFHAVACEDCCVRIIEGDDSRKYPMCRDVVAEFKKIFMQNCTTILKIMCFSI